MPRLPGGGKQPGRGAYNVQKIESKRKGTTPRVFICYRRDDAPHAAGRIADQLAQRFGDHAVFRDVSALEPGVDFQDRILSVLPVSDVVLAVIGPYWQGLSRRLSETNDVLRQELEYALNLRLPVIPVLVDATAMPQEKDLPDPLRAIARREGCRVRDADFRYDMDQLIHAILQHAGQKLIEIPAPGPGAPITGEHLALINSSWRSPRHDYRFPGNQVYRFDVILAGDPAALARVEKVGYLLPPAWPTSPSEVENPMSNFGLKELAWSDLLVRARVYVHHQMEPVYLSSFVRLTETGRRLVPRA